MKDREDVDEEGWVEILKVVAHILQQGKHNVQAEKGSADEYERKNRGKEGEPQIHKAYFTAAWYHFQFKYYLKCLI